MWEWRYADEPQDNRLFWLRFAKKIWIVLFAGVCGAALCGGIYFLKESVFVKERLYQAKNDTYVEYIPEEGYGISTVYLNGDVWKALIVSDEFTANMSEELSGRGMTVSAEEIAGSLDASIEKDTRIVTVRATTPDAALSAAIAEAAQNAILKFGETYRDIDYCYVLKRAQGAEPVLTGVWQVRVTVVGGVCGLLAAVFFVCLAISADDSVYIPDTLEKRYQIPALGVNAGGSMLELKENAAYLCGDAERIMVVPVEGDIPAEEIVKALGACAGKENGNRRFEAGKCPLDEPESARELRGADAVILAVGAGRHDGGRIGRTISFLKKQDCPLKGAVLWGADERLQKCYYGYRSPEKKDADAAGSAGGEKE